MDSIDIIIKSWNAANYTKLAVGSLQNNSDYPINIFIIDNGSNPENLQILESLQSVNLVKLDKNYGAGYAARVGFEKTKSRIFVLMDNDIVVQKDWLSCVIDYFKDQNVGLVSPLRYSSLTNYPETETSSREKWLQSKEISEDPNIQIKDYLGKFNSLDEFRSRLVSDNNLSDMEFLSPPGFVSSSCIVLNREALTKVGGIIGDDFVGWGGDDVDLCWRLGYVGHKVIRTVKSYVHHFEHASMKANKATINLRLAESNKLLYKHWSEKMFAIKEKNNLQIDDPRYPFLKIFYNIKEGRGVNVF